MIRHKNISPLFLIASSFLNMKDILYKEMEGRTTSSPLNCQHLCQHSFIHCWNNPPLPPTNFKYLTKPTQTVSQEFNTTSVFTSLIKASRVHAAFPAETPQSSLQTCKK